MTSQQTNEVTEIELPTLPVLRTVKVGRNPNWIGLTPDGHLAVVSNTDDDTVSLLDLKDFRPAATIPVGDQPKRLAVGWVQAAR